MPKVPRTPKFNESPRISGHAAGTRNFPVVTITDPHPKSKHGAVKTTRPAIQPNYFTVSPGVHKILRRGL